MSRFSIMFAGILAMGLISSCSTGSSPVAPATPNNLTGTQTIHQDGNTQLWGIWDIAIDPETQTIDAVPLRGAEFTVNVTKFIDGPPLNLLLNFVSITPGAGYTDMKINVGIHHPFPGYDMYAGFDVLGVFMGNGADTYGGPEAFPTTGDFAQQLMNPDGYTRWFNSDEFASVTVPLFGYYPGKLGPSGYTPTSVLNPYKYFTDGLDPEDSAFEYIVDNAAWRGSFDDSSTNRRIYDLRFYQSAGLKFQYAIVADWKAPLTYPDPPSSINDFPQAANAAESRVLSVVDNSDLYYLDSLNFGGSAKLRISVIDFFKGSTFENNFEIKCYSDAWTGDGDVDMTPVGSGNIYWTFAADIPAQTMTSSDPLPVWVEVSYPAHDWSNIMGLPNDATGPLASYFLINAKVDDQAPPEPSITVLSPNGGEFWYIGSNHTITWTSNLVPGNVNIGLVKYGAVVQLIPIASDVPNNGTYDWIVPDEPGDTFTVLVSSVENPFLYDESDDYFTIGESSGNFVYAFGDIGFFTEALSPGNTTMFTNMFNLPLTGPYSENEIVKYYYGKCDDYLPPSFEFPDLVSMLGYTWDWNNSPTLDITGVKMLIVTFLFPSSSNPPYTPEEIDLMRELVNGGGLLIILVDNPGVMSYNVNLDALLLALVGDSIAFVDDESLFDPYYDISPDPITVGVTQLEANAGGRFELTGPAVSLVREDVTAYNAITKAPML